MATNKVSFVNNDDIDKKVNIVLGQTDYSREKALSLLEQNDYNEISVIKGYFGITEKKAPKISSLNQEIYKQIRHKLDGAMKEYNERKK